MKDHPQLTPSKVLTKVVSSLQWGEPVIKSIAQAVDALISVFLLADWGKG